MAFEKKIKRELTEDGEKQMREEEQNIRHFFLNINNIYL